MLLFVENFFVVLISRVAFSLCSLVPGTEYAIDVRNLLFLARLEFLCKTGCVPHYVQYKEVAFLSFPQNLSLRLFLARNIFDKYLVG